MSDIELNDDNSPQEIRLSMTADNIQLPSLSADSDVSGDEE